MSFKNDLPEGVFTEKDNRAAGDCLFESISDGLARNVQLDIFDDNPFWTDAELRQLVCGFYKEVFACARKAAGDYVRNDGYFVFDQKELKRLQQKYEVNQDLWQHFLYYLENVKDEFLDENEYTEESFKDVDLDELKEMCTLHGIKIDSKNRVTREMLIDLIVSKEQLYHFNLICSPMEYAGIADIHALGIVCRINVLIYEAHTKSLETVVWYSNDSATVVILYKNENHFVALLPRKADFLDRLQKPFGRKTKTSLCTTFDDD
jgi:hypothetical protein